MSVLQQVCCDPGAPGFRPSNTSHPPITQTSSPTSQCRLLVLCLEYREICKITWHLDKMNSVCPLTKGTRKFECGSNELVWEYRQLGSRHPTPCISCRPPPCQDITGYWPSSSNPTVNWLRHWSDCKAWWTREKLGEVVLNILPGVTSGISCDKKLLEYLVKVFES